MTRILDRKALDTVKVGFIKSDLDISLSRFQAWKHALWMEYEEKGGGTASNVESDDYSGKGNRYYRFHNAGEKHNMPKDVYYPTKVLDQIEPVKLHKGTKLVLKDRIKTFKDIVKSYKKKGKINKIPLILAPSGYIYASSTSEAMKKNMLVLELTFDAEGKLYSPKTFNYDWSWQGKAIWQRTIGMTPSRIATSLNKPLNTIKAMFQRLKISEFFIKYSVIDWATTGYGRAEGATPSGWRAVLQGGSNSLLYPEDNKFVAKYTIGEMAGSYREGLLETEHFSIDRLQKDIKYFNEAKHEKEVIKRNKQDQKRKEKIVLEQETIEKKNREKNKSEMIEKGIY